MAQIVSFDDGAFDRALLRGSTCVFGVFDGVHIGHRFLIESACARAEADGSVAIALTFDRDPDELFRPESLRKIQTNEERLSMLAKSGVDYVVTLPFTRVLAGLEPEEFLERAFGDFSPASIHVGCDFRFGNRASGTVDTMRAWGGEHGVDVVAYELAQCDGLPVTATRIRELLATGNIRGANKLLGRRYAVAGVIESGRQQGREMGFATANVSIPANRQTLGAGVYAAYAFVGETRYKAAVSVGVSPTFEDATAVCEAHLLDFEGDIYGDDLMLEFVEFLRPMIKFESLEALIAEVTANIQWCRDNLE